MMKKLKKIDSNILMFLFYFIAALIQITARFTLDSYHFERGLFAGIFLSIGGRYLFNFIEKALTKRRLRRIIEEIEIEL